MGAGKPPTRWPPPVTGPSGPGGSLISAVEGHGEPAGGVLVLLPEQRLPHRNLGARLDPEAGTALPAQAGRGIQHRTTGVFALRAVFEAVVPGGAPVDLGHQPQAGAARTRVLEVVEQDVSITVAVRALAIHTSQHARPQGPVRNREGEMESAGPGPRAAARLKVDVQPLAAGIVQV